MDIEDRIRDAVKADRRPEPSARFHGRVMAGLPARRGAARWPAPTLAVLIRLGGVAALLALVVAAVGLPLTQSRPGIAAPDESATAPAVATIGPLGTALAPSMSPTVPGSHFTPTGDLMLRDGGGPATLLADGRVLVLSGNAVSPELYDPATGKFGPTGSISTARGGETATRLLDGRVLVAGGFGVVDSTAGAGLSSAELYDPRTGEFSPTGSMATDRYYHTASLLPDGRVLIAGGYHVTDVMRTTSEGVGAAGEELASAELYDPKTGTFSPTGSMSTRRSGHTAVPLADGRVLVLGGGMGPAFLATAEIYDPNTGTFGPTGSMPDNRQGYAATLLPDGHVLVSGGFILSPEVGQGPSDVPTAELYDPATGKFSQTGTLIQPRVSATATRLADGRVLVAGGITHEKVGVVSVAQAELYDPSTGLFSDAGSMVTARGYATATLLLDGRVLIAGGVAMTTTADELGSAEIYQP
jgi:hypothetical protein